MNLDLNERDLFLSALEIEDPAARKSHLQAACGDNVELLSQVEALLASHQRESQFLRTPVGEQLGPTETDATLVMGLGSTHEAPPRDAEPAASELEFKRNPQHVEMSEEIPLGYLEPSQKPDSLGRLGHYEILEVIGRGAFGTVLRAFDEKLHRVVAIKVMALELASTSPARKRFLREAQSSAQIRHEHVVSVYAVEEKPIPYLVMEYIPGQTLQQRLDEKGPLDLPDILRLAVQIAEGLAAAHAMDLIHRDIKPGNILLETGVRDRVKITDFGLARAADDASMTQSGMIAGTPMYMAPEQAHGHKLDQRADLFSLGSVLYQMATGRPPFRANGTLAVLKRVAEDTPRDIREIVPEVPQWLCDIIAKLHAKNPDERFQTAREVADVLGDCEAQLKANSKLKDFSRIPRTRRRPTPGMTWRAAVSIGIPVSIFLGVALAVYIATADKRNQPEALGVHASQTKSAPPPNAIAPFGTAQAKQHQEAWAKHLGVPVEFTNSVGMKFVLIPPGEATLGSSDQEIKDLLAVVPDWAHDDIRTEAPQRRITIPEPFYLGTCEVTVGQFKRFVAATQFKTHAETNGKGGIAWTGSEHATRPEFTWLHPDNHLSDEHPLGQICASDAIAFCNWLKTTEGRNYILPDEDQWEFACRAGTVTPWSCGTDLASHKAHGLVGWDLLFTGRQVAQIPANPFGLFDVHGNMGELCRTKDGGYVSRGGHSGTEPNLVRSAFRDVVGRLDSYRLHGFRVAITGPLKSPNDATRPVQVAKQESLPATFKNSIGMQFVKVPKGKSWLGGGKDKPGDRKVEIPTDFYLGKYEVTQEEWEKVMGENPSLFSRTGWYEKAVQDIDDASLKRFPVENVSWEDCLLFVKQLNEREKSSGWTYRMPTETEWEYASRGGPMADKAESEFDFYFAQPTNDVRPHQANFKHELGLNRTAKVGSYEPNRFGLFDMFGNVCEWCSNDDGAPDAASRPVIWGGGWNNDFGNYKVAPRGVGSTTDKHFAIGFRLAAFPTALR